MKKNVLFGIIAAVVVLCVIVALVVNQRGREQNKDVIKIGAILPLTGKYADAGTSVQAGIQLAVNEINENSNKKFEVIYYDTESDVKKSTTGFKRLRQVDKVKIFFTTTSDHSLTLKPLAINDATLLFAFGSHLDITKDNKQLIYRPQSTGIDEGKAMLNYINDNLASKNIFLYSANVEAGVVFEQYIKSHLQDKLSGTCLYNEDASNVRNLTSLPQIKSADCVIVFGFTPMMGSIIKSLRESGYTGDIISNLGFFSPSVLATAGEYARSTYYVDYDLPYHTKEFQQKDAIAKRDFKTSFSSLGYTAYGTLLLLNKAIKQNDSIDEIKKFLSQDQEHDIDGTIFSTKIDGSITMPMVVRKY